MVKDLNDPSNVDTVPALLTAGEFVLNKEAAQMFAPMLEQMNEVGLNQRQAENVQMLNTGGQALSRDEFMKQLIPEAQKVGKELGIDPRIIMAQAIQETGWGEKAPGQNYFGIKSHGQAGGQDVATHEYVDGKKTAVTDSFRGYDSLADSVRGYGEFIKSNPRYEGFLGAQGLDAQLDALGQSGYATDPNYGKNLGNIISGPTFNKYYQPPAEQEAPPISEEQIEASRVPDYPPDAAPTGALQVQTGVQQPQPQQQQDQTPDYGGAIVDALYSHFGYNEGGPIRLNEGGWWSKLFNNAVSAPDPNAGYANYSQQDFVDEAQTINNPGAQTQGFAVPEIAQPSIPGSAPDAVPVQAAPDSFGPTATHVGNRLNMAFPQGPEVPPALDQVPPEALSDELLLQESSDTAEQEEWLSMVDPADLAAAGLNPDGSMGTGMGAIDSGIIGPDSAPSPAYIQAQIETGNLTVPQLADSGVPPEILNEVQENIVRGQSSGLIPPEEINAPAVETAVAELATNPTQDPQQEVKQPKPQGPAETSQAVRVATEEAAQGEPPISKDEAATAIAAGEKAPPAQIDMAKNLLQENFGDLFDKKELARAAVLFAGAMATGLSPQRALAYAGTGYINRLDAKAAQKSTQITALANSGKYTPDSIAAFEKTGDVGQLTPTGTAIERTGQYETFYGNGKQIQAEKVKAGESSYWVDENGKRIDGTQFNQDPSTVKGTKEYATRVRQDSKTVSDQLTELQKNFGTFKGSDGEDITRTDLSPKTSGPKIAQWAIENEVDPAEVGGIVESAYHDMLNDKRQDGSRARSIVPYLEQLVVRQQVGANASAFNAKGWSGEGTPQYVNPKKLTTLNSAVGNALKSKGLKGNTSDLSNLFYNEALLDWNELDQDVRDEWKRSALDDESGFYKFAENMIIGG